MTEQAAPCRLYVISYIPDDGPARVYKQSVCFSLEEVTERLGEFLTKQAATWTDAKFAVEPNYRDLAKAIGDGHYLEALTKWNDLYGGSGDRVIVLEHAWDKELGRYATTNREWS